jgi:spermidine synthase
VLAERLRQRQLVVAQVGSTWLLDRLLPFHLARYRAALGGAGFENRDFRPVVYLFGLLESLERWSPPLARWVRRGSASSVTLIRAVAVATGGLVLALLIARVRRRGPAIAFAMAAAGAASMVLQLVLLLTYQALRGHLYHTLGLLLAVSMSGLAAGASIAERVLPGKRGLALACGGLAGVAMTVAVTLAIAPWRPGVAVAAIAPLLLASGMAAGAVFTMAIRAAHRPQAGARVYAWDLLGGALAAFSTSLLAIPLLGLLPVALLAGLICALAALASLV